MPPKKKADDRPAIFAAIDKGDDEALKEMLSADSGMINLRNKVTNSLLVAARCMTPLWMNDTMHDRMDGPL
jgi:hypothetical protein